MAIADYSTSTEKIAALKAAMIDPSLVQIATSDFTTSETIYAINFDFRMNGIVVDTRHDNSLTIPSKISSGISLTSIYSFLYIKDSDILYSEPITTYQDRLVKIIESELKISSGNISAGTYGSIVKAIPEEYTLKVNGRNSEISNRYTTIPIMVPIPNGSTFCSTSGTAGVMYIDLPAGW